MLILQGTIQCPETVPAGKRPSSRYVPAQTIHEQYAQDWQVYAVPFGD